MSIIASSTLVVFVRELFFKKSQKAVGSDVASGVDLLVESVDKHCVGLRVGDGALYAYKTIVQW